MPTCLNVRFVVPGGLNCFHRDSPLFPARSGALVVRSLSAWGSTNRRECKYFTGAAWLLRRVG
jgi:hypothetical protein